MKKIVFTLALLLISKGLIGNNDKFTNRGLIILLDTSEQITKDNFKNESRKLFGALTTTALAALDQKAAPILITQTLLRSAVLPSMMAKDVKNKIDFSEFLKKYPGASMVELERGIKNNSLAKKNYQRIADAALLNFNYWDWIVRRASDDIYLLIPRNYLPELKDYVNAEREIRGSPNELELKIGFKLDHMGAVDSTLFKTEMLKEKQINELKAIDDFDSENFFVTNQEYYKANKSSLIPKWVIYFSGHGLGINATKINIKALTETFSTAENYYTILKEAFDNIATTYKDDSYQATQEQAKFFSVSTGKKGLQIFLGLVETITKELEKVFLYNSEIITSKMRIEWLKKELKNKEISYTHYIIYIFETFQELKNLFTTLITNKSGIIAGVPLPLFKEFLDSLDTKINTRFLYFTSCFAGGQVLEQLYNSTRKTLEGKTYSFIIASDAFTDAPCSIYSFTVKEGKLVFEPNFTQFFTTLNNLNKSITPEIDPSTKKLVKKPSKTITSTILEAVGKINGFRNRMLLGDVSNIPHIKLPGLEFTKLIDSKEVIAIDSILASTFDPNKTLTQSFFGIQPKLDIVSALLLYTSVIPFSIKLELPIFCFNFVSMTPGKNGQAYHILKKLKIPYNKDEFAKSLLGIEGLSTKKLFWIKKVKLKDKEVLKDVIATYNLNNDKLLSNQKPTLFYYTKNNIQYVAEFDPESEKLSNEYTYSLYDKDGNYVTYAKEYLQETFGSNYDKLERDTQPVKEAITKQQLSQKLIKQAALLNELDTLKNWWNNLDSNEQLIIKTTTFHPKYPPQDPNLRRYQKFQKAQDLEKQLSEKEKQTAQDAFNEQLKQTKTTENEAQKIKKEREALQAQKNINQLAQALNSIAG